MCLSLLSSDADPEDRGGMRGERGSRDNRVFLTETPRHPGSVILGRPTATSITASVMWDSPIEAVLAWGTGADTLAANGPRVRLTPWEPREIELTGLSPDTRYFYELREVSTGRRLLPSGRPGSFHTARKPGQNFTFDIQADSHLDGGCSLELYRQTLANELSDKPDFLIDLGDTFMTDKHPNRESAEAQYFSQRYNFSLVAHSVPLFLALGNHDGEGPDRHGDTSSQSLGVWAQRMRVRFFPNPVPNGFYTGNALRHPALGLLGDYYAWEWGDALFVVLDPYWSSLPTRRGQEPWNLTLGDAQYDWLARTLRGSKVHFKFVFIHQLTSGYHPQGRGGTEAAAYHEWGGRDLDGKYALNLHRPNWKAPVHKLLADNKVTAVFHGHDHFYARQELDGVIYQLVPQPGHRNSKSHHAEEYDYEKGQFLPNSGYLRVEVKPEGARVEYVRSVLSENNQKDSRNANIAASYTINSTRQ